VAFVGQTRLLALLGEEAEEIELEGFLHTEQSLLCANLDDHYYLQVG
jgi:hypothetical protein